MLWRRSWKFSEMVVRLSSQLHGLHSATRTETEGSIPLRIQQAAAQFEALLITQLLRASRQGGGEGWLGTGDDQAASAATEMAEECFAQALASQGGLGLARMIAEELFRASQARQPAVSNSPAGTSSCQGLPHTEGA